MPAIIYGPSYFSGAQPSGPVGIPHLQVPLLLTGDGSFAIWQQDTIEEVSQSVEVICGSNPGERTMAPTFGMPQLTFTEPSAGLITQTIAQWDPRAVTQVSVNNGSIPGTSSIGVKVSLQSKNQVG
jgi:phage baseplate assembly protein W